MVRSSRRGKEDESPPTIKEPEVPVEGSTTIKTSQTDATATTTTTTAAPPSKKSVAPKKAIKAKEAAAVAAAAKEQTEDDDKNVAVMEPKEEETATAADTAVADATTTATPMEVEPEEEESKKTGTTTTTKKGKKTDEPKTEDISATTTNNDSVKKEDKTTEEPEPEDDPNAIWAPTDFDVLSGRGASVNSHGFRALCFANKPQFEAGNHAAKRRIATEIVDLVLNNGEARFLRRKSEKGPWLVLTKEQAILKACQVMRDYKRPDRIAQRQMMAANGQARKRVRQVESTPLPEDYVAPTEPLPPIVENPFGVHDHDILCGRGAFVNGHIGNQRLRTLAQERKAAFDAGNYTEKRSLANEIVAILKALDPPGRFLKKASSKNAEGGAGGGGDDDDDNDNPNAFTHKTKDDEPAPSASESEWVELGDEKAIHKACQVMRDIDRPDRKDREERRLKKKQKTTAVLASGSAATTTDKKMTTTTDDKNDERRKKDEEEAVSEAVAATEEALDIALDAAVSKVKDEITKAEEKSVEV